MLAANDEEAEKECITESLEWGTHIDKNKTDVNENPSGAYNKLSEALRQSFPHEATCSMFCGGKKCKYCCCDTWKDDEQAVKGLYSHWVTENILAMSRPITKYVKQFDIISQFKRLGLTAIINLQLPGEHYSCGDGLHNNEFSYRQQDFMDAGIFFYNFGWDDFGVVESMTEMLDMVKVMQFAVTEERWPFTVTLEKVHWAVCRTGVLIGCFLVFQNRVTANEAVHYVRSRRPGSVQTAPQVKCVQDFERFLRPYRVVFHTHADCPAFNLTQFLSRQKGILHGFQARKLKFLPKIIYVICERLLQLAKKKELLHIPTDKSVAVELETAPSALRISRTIQNTNDGVSSDPSLDGLSLDEVPDGPTTHRHSINGIHGQGEVLEEVNHICQALANEKLSTQDSQLVTNYEKKLNGRGCGLGYLRQENNPYVLSQLLWNWLNQLKDPVLRAQYAELMFDHVEDPHTALEKWTKAAGLPLCT
ncbi:PTPDC1 [Bugula neritina]|uniref:PTPDC1 n=1 Tax=Bugula neritina TaxID=10212 RepID=A0A7J7JV45_BUGNE|nr:PTPDC1 [Bugula neritina]